MNTKFDKIFRKNELLKNEELLDYLSDQLSLEDTHRVEELLVDNEFYSDAAEGLEMLNNIKRNKLIQDIKQETEIIAKENSSNTDWQQILKIAVAAGVALLVGLFFLFKEDDIMPSSRHFINDSTPKEVAALSERKEINNNDEQPKHKSETGSDGASENTTAALNEDIEDDDDTDDKTTLKAEKSNGNHIAIKQRKTSSVSAALMYGTTTDSVAVNDITPTNEVSKEASSEIMENALKKFKKGKYEKATLLFEKELLTNSENQKAAYYCGIAYYQLQNYTAAYIKFAGIVNSTTNKYTDDALWYKAQALINMKDIPAAKICLSQLVSANSKHRLAAQKLLSSLH